MPSEIDKRLLGAGASSANGAVGTLYFGPRGAGWIDLWGVNRLLLYDHWIGLHEDWLPGSLVNQYAANGCRHRPTPATAVAPSPMTMAMAMSDAVPMVLGHR